MREQQGKAAANEDETMRPAKSNSASLASDQLKGYMSEIQRLEDEKKQISDDISEVYKAAKAKGFNTDVMREIFKRQKMTPEERTEREAQVDLYEGVLGLSEHPGDAEAQGFEAASRGLPVTANPFTKKSPKYARWELAWQMQTGLMASDDQSGETDPDPDHEEAAEHDTSEAA